MGRLAKDYLADARQVIERAHEKANQLGHDYLGQEHLLLGIADCPDCPAASLLAKSGVRGDALSAAVLAKVAPGDAPPSGRLQRTPSAKRAMRLASAWAKQAGRGAAGSEDILVGILRAGEGLGWEVLASLGVTAKSVIGEEGKGR
jgi:ATP-dependent Clp protease ATP-binding subunit ClpC